MKVSDEPDSGEKEMHINVRKHLNEDEILSLLFSVFGCADLMARESLEKWYNEAVEPPKTMLYGMLMFGQYMIMMGSIVRDEIPKGEKINIGYMPTSQDAWKTDEDLDKRIVIFVKCLYEEYVKAGRICPTSS